LICSTPALALYNIGRNEAAPMFEALNGRSLAYTWRTPKKASVGSIQANILKLSDQVQRFITDFEPDIKTPPD